MISYGIARPTFRRTREAHWMNLLGGRHERGVAEVGIQVEDLRPVRHDRLREVSLRIEHLLEEGVLLRITIEHDIRRAYELREEVLRRVVDLDLELVTQSHHRLRVAI